MTDEQMRRYFHALSYGANIVDAASYAGFHRDTAYEARKKVPGFREEELLAQDEGAVKVGGTRVLSRMLNWPVVQRVREGAEVYCAFCGDEIVAPSEYHRSNGSSRGAAHTDCAAEQSENYDKLTKLLRGES